MLHYPDVQKKAQAELDAVVGQDRMPEYEDKENLLYIQAIIKETLRSVILWFIVKDYSEVSRWRPVAILGGSPHAVTADDVYNGM